MGLLRGTVKTAVAMKALEIVRREASKPENQRKAKELFARLSKRRATR